MREAGQVVQEKGKGQVAVEGKWERPALKGPVIAIDGPSGAGKSTVARRVAERLGYSYIDTGAMYRAMALKVLRSGIDPQDAAAVGRAAEATQVAVSGAPPGRVWLDGEDVTEAVRDPEVSRVVSRVARVPAVRARLSALQRSLAEPGRVVVEGRDIGTCVLPDAEVKVFLTASLAERARRRQQELERAGHRASVAQVRREMESRDVCDASRELAPLAVAEGAVVIDTTSLSVEEVVEAVLRECADL